MSSVQFNWVQFSSIVFRVCIHLRVVLGSIFRVAFTDPRLRLFAWVAARFAWAGPDWAGLGLYVSAWLFLAMTRRDVRRYHRFPFYWCRVAFTDPRLRWWILYAAQSGRISSRRSPLRARDCFNFRAMGWAHIPRAAHSFAHTVALIFGLWAGPVARFFKSNVCFFFLFFLFAFFV
jgi:hypothetical protein